MPPNAPSVVGEGVIFENLSERGLFSEKRLKRRLDVESTQICSPNNNCLTRKIEFLIELVKSYLSYEKGRFHVNKLDL